ncbi:MAG: hypothetical protein M1335_02930, partial [Chloroflexi bacterium]|nr:hypothetical protein [Chloroflexota bacterium]
MASAKTAKRASAAEKRKLGEFLGLFSYAHGFFESRVDYVKLKKRLEDIDAGWGMCSNKLFYLAVPPRLYPDILKNLASTGLGDPCGGPDEGWTRIIVEKPFGSDLPSAKALDVLLGKLFHEDQIYRIDHYLAKEMLQNIIAFRFSNALFEANWDRNGIAEINIRLWEDKGVEERGVIFWAVKSPVAPRITTIVGILGLSIYSLGPSGERRDVFGHP